MKAKEISWLRDEGRGVGSEAAAVDAPNGDKIVPGRHPDVIYTSDCYSVVEFPQENGYEVIDRYAGRGIYFDGVVADRFRRLMIAALASDPTPEGADAFIGGFDTGASYPLQLH